MLDVPWAPLTGASVITRQAWDAIPAEYHAPFLEVARQIGAANKAEIRRQDVAAIKVMQKYGLKVETVDEAARRQWADLAHGLYPVLRGPVVPADLFDQTVRIVETCKAR
jgi:TRAP-type C4-dicarboxylate transport system substrate-binding protein